MAGWRSCIPQVALTVGLMPSIGETQSCQTTTVQSTLPAINTNVALQSYSYCGGYLNVTAYVANLDYDKVVTLYYTNRQNVSTALSVIGLGYNSSVEDEFEIWGAYTPVYWNGITQLSNLTFQATDLGETFSQSLNLTISASGTAAPSPDTTPPRPYATPSGLSQDITTWLSTNGTSQAISAKRFMFSNINPNVSGPANGTVVAAQSGPSYPQTDPDYEYNWVRDSSLTMDVVEILYDAADNSSASMYEDILFQYAAARATEQNDPGLQSGLGEPKFYLNNTIFTGPWGRPQNDGPATSAIALINFSNAYIGKGGNFTTVLDNIYNSSANINAPVLKDLLFVASNWTSPSFDLWEEEESDHFYTRMVQRRALLMGKQFAQDLGDNATANTLTAAADALSATLVQFWDPNRQILVYEYGPVLNNKESYKDIAVVLGILHGYAGDGVYSYTDHQVLSSALQISTSFLSVFPIANTTSDASGQVLGIPIGRYPEDVFNGTATESDGGNPWFLATASMAELFYRAVLEYQTIGNLTVTNTSQAFFSYYAPAADVTTGQTYSNATVGFQTVMNSLEGWADAFMRRIKYHAPGGGHFNEEYNRNTGVAQGAADLTWSYAAVLTAAFARAESTGETDYVSALASLPI